MEDITDVDEGPADAAVSVKTVVSKIKCEETMLGLCQSYDIPSDLYKPLLAKEYGWGTPPPEASNALCVFEAMLEVGVKFPLHEVYNRILTHFNLAPGQLVPSAWRYLVGFVLLCEEVGVTPMAAVFRHYFSLHSKGNGWYNFKTRCKPLFNCDGGFCVNPRWREMFFFLQPITADNPWRCPKKLGEPVKEDYEISKLSGAVFLAISKLERKKCRSLKKLIISNSRYNENFPVLPSLHEQIKAKIEINDEDDVTVSTHPSKRLCLSATATATAMTIPPSRQLLTGTTSSAPLDPVISPSSTTVVGNNELSKTQMVCQIIQDTDMELRIAKQKLASEQM